MARNGAGVYSLATPGNPVVTGSVISSTTHNATMSDIATALTASLASDGQTTPTANLPMGAFKHTGVGNAAARTHYASAADVQDGSVTYLTSPTGTDTIAATAPLTMAAYAAGQVFRFIASGANTGAVTLNINSIGAKAVTKLGTDALVTGDINAGQAVEVIYDGTRFQMLAPAINTLTYTALYTSSGTFTVPAGFRAWYIECVGAGAGGGSGRRDAAGTTRLGGWAGGGGARTQAILKTLVAGAAVTVTVGAGGTGGAAQTSDATDGNAGTDGGNSSFGSYLVAYGGEGGDGGVNATNGAASRHCSAGGGSGGKGAGGSGGAPQNNYAGGETSSGDTTINNNMGGGGAGGSDRNTPGCAEWGGGAGGGSLTAATAYGGGGAIYGGCGGGGGGGIDAADVNRAGGAGGTNGYTVGGGSAAGVAGTDGTGIVSGTGGGGGTPAAGVGAAGGAGGAVGGGGGGGSASVNGQASGAGGNGGRGEVRVWGLL